MRFSFLKWSRALHKWLGIYVAVLTAVWIGELLFLPLAYPVKEMDRASVKNAHETAAHAGEMTFGMFFRRLQSGVYGKFGPNVELGYIPRERKYTVRDQDSFVVCEVSGDTGQIISRRLDESSLFAEKSGLAWLSKPLASILKGPFEISFVILAVTGVYLVLFPYLRRKRPAGEGILSLSAGDRFRFMTTLCPKDMARIAALGLLPGVNATIVRISRRGPVVLSARNTRIAVARTVAASFLFEKMES